MGPLRNEAASGNVKWVVKKPRGWLAKREPKQHTMFAETTTKQRTEQCFTSRIHAKRVCEEAQSPKLVSNRDANDKNSLLTDQERVVRKYNQNDDALKSIVRPPDTRGDSSDYDSDEEGCFDFENTNKYVARIGKDQAVNEMLMHFERRHPGRVLDSIWT